MTRPNRAPSRRRSGAAAVEMAVMLPFLLYLAMIGVDYGRIVYSLVTITNAARNAAMYQADPALAATLPYASAALAGQAEAANLSPAPSVSTASGTDASGNAYVEATVTYTFRGLSRYPGLPRSVTLRRTVRMPVPPS
jgi:Flp pilus assembly protein TadG